MQRRPTLSSEGWPLALEPVSFHRAAGWKESHWHSVFFLHHSQGVAETHLVTAWVDSARALIDSSDRTSLMLMVDAVMPPNAAARAEIAQFFRHHGSQLNGIGIWIRAQGIYRSAVRGAATGILMLNGPNVPTCFPVNREEASRWVNGQTMQSFDAADLAIQQIMVDNAD